MITVQKAMGLAAVFQKAYQVLLLLSNSGISNLKQKLCTIQPTS